MASVLVLGQEEEHNGLVALEHLLGCGKVLKFGVTVDGYIASELADVVFRKGILLSLH